MWYPQSPQDDLVRSITSQESDSPPVKDFQHPLPSAQAVQHSIGGSERQKGILSPLASCSCASSKRRGTRVLDAEGK